MEVQRLLLVDDHALFRDGMAGLFAYEDDFEVVGEAEDGEAALAAARELMPDLVLMDIDMPGCDGLEATRRLKREMPYVKVVVLTVHDDDEKLFEAIKAGAQGYLVKSIRSTEMLELLRGMSRGEAPISRAMAARILAEFARTATGSGSGAPGAAGAAEAAEPEAPESLLSLREQEVLELVARRYTNKEIAAQLVISEYTVKNHLRNILSKLHLRSRTQAARYAMGRGLVGDTARQLPPNGAGKRVR
jgi:DNA-binding NarL/FixJ family response regulator